MGDCKVEVIWMPHYTDAEAMKDLKKRLERAATTDRVQSSTLKELAEWLDWWAVSGSDSEPDDTIELLRIVAQYAMDD